MTDHQNDPALEKPENTPGVFLEHFDLSHHFHPGVDSVVYGHVLKAAREAASTAGWTFRSYSSEETAASADDFEARTIRDFPTLILWNDGRELGRSTSVVADVSGLLAWAETLLGGDA